MVNCITPQTFCQPNIKMLSSSLAIREINKTTRDHLYQLEWQLKVRETTGTGEDVGEIGFLHCVGIN